MVTVGMFHAIGGQVGLDRFAFDVKAEAVAAVVTDLTELGFQPRTCNVVVGQGSAMLKVSLVVVVDLFRHRRRKRSYVRSLE